MEIYTSYFYQIRNFKPWHIPFSTAVFDPKWFHNGRDQSYRFMDKNGVVNGLRLRDFVPGDECNGLCNGSEGCEQVQPCEFLTKYEEQLRKLNPIKIEQYFKSVCPFIMSKLDCNIANPLPILIVHEAPSNPCSERVVIQRVLNDMGFTCREWRQGD